MDDNLFDKLCRAVENAGGTVLEKYAENIYPSIIYSLGPEEHGYRMVAMLDYDNQVLTFLQNYNLPIGARKAGECAVIINLINQSLPAGAFSARKGSGHVYYVLTNDFVDCSLGEEALTQLVKLPVMHMVRYEDMFAAFQFEELRTSEFVAQLPSWEEPPVEKDQETESVFSYLQSLLKRRNTDFIKDEEKMSLRFRAKVGEKAIEMELCVDATQKKLLVTSRLPFKVKPVHRVDMAVAVCSVTSKLNEGTFIYDIPNGELWYRTTSFYAGSQIADGHINYLITCVAAMVDIYQERFHLLNAGELSLQAFLEQS